MTQSVLIPLNNVYAKGDYCAEVMLGNPPQLYHLIIDSGSSTLVVHPDRLNDDHSDTIAATPYLQFLRYGIGDWYGPVVHTDVHLGNHLKQVIVQSVSLAIAEHEAEGTFAKADGIMGLAYSQLNIAHDVTLLAKDQQSQTPWPWTQEWQTLAAEPNFVADVQSQPSVAIKPVLCQLASEHIIPNQFALLIHRSSIFQTSQPQTEAQLMAHPLNKGIMAIGNPLLHHDLHVPSYQAVKVMYDKYYNVNLTAVKVGDNAVIDVPPMVYSESQPKRSNAIVDTGASAMVLPEWLFEKVFAQLGAAGAGFTELLKPYKAFTGHETGIPIESVELDKWPNIVFIFEGETQAVELTLTPHAYWQVHAPEPNQVSFKMTTLPGWGAQVIIGLPLLSEYYSIFDRSKNTTGVILFAEKQDPLHRMAHQS